MYVLDIDYYKAGKIVKYEVVERAVLPVCDNEGNILTYITMVKIVLACYRMIYFTNENFQCSKEGVLSKSPTYLLID